jgi:hypothetical protein
MARKIYTRAEFEAMKKEDLEKLTEAILLDDGSIVPSPRKEFIAGLDGPMTLKDQIEGIIGSYLFQKSMHDQGHETLEESEDFDISDEPNSRLDFNGYDVQEMVEEKVDSSLPLEDTQVEKDDEVMKAEPESVKVDSDDILEFQGKKYAPIAE